MTIEEEIMDLRKQVHALTERVKLLEKENKFMEELNVRLMQTKDDGK